MHLAGVKMEETTCQWIRQYRENESSPWQTTWKKGNLAFATVWHEIMSVFWMTWWLILPLEPTSKKTIWVIFDSSFERLRRTLSCLDIWPIELWAKKHFLNSKGLWYNRNVIHSVSKFSVYLYLSLSLSVSVCVCVLSHQVKCMIPR